VEYHDSSLKWTAGGDTAGDDIDMMDLWKSSVKAKGVEKVADFELEDYWGYGEPLAGRALCPLAVTLNIVSSSQCVPLLGIAYSPYLLVHHFV